MRRRDFLSSAAVAGGALALGPAFLRDALASSAVPGPGPYGPLGPPNAIGMRLPAGFTGREVARGATVVGGYPWHFAPDGQATFASSDGGYVLVQNSEVPGVTGGGSSAIRFSADGEIERAYRILAGTNLNCGGGPTPWGTWLSGEEHPGGLMWEADPAGILPAQPRPALGNFAHEAAAVDRKRGDVYLTEDVGDGCFYRFEPVIPGSLLTGLLSVAKVGPTGKVDWVPVPDPNIVLSHTELRNQVPGATRFNGGEGVWFDDGIVYFTTKGDKRVWAYDTNAKKIEVIFDGKATPGAALNAVDNVTVTASGDVYVCEDGGNMEIGIITPEPHRVVAPFVQLVGPEHAESEMTGVIFDPSGTRMYFSSQRAHPYAPQLTAIQGDARVLAHGATYEVTGPFRIPAGGVPADKVFGPPAGEAALPLPAATRAGGLKLRAPRRASRRAIASDGLQAWVRLREPATVHAVLRTAEAQTITTPRWHEPRPVLTTLARGHAELSAGAHQVHLRGIAAGLRELRGVPAGSRAILTVVAVSRRGRQQVAADVVEI
jgi:hypothetical protein